MSQDDGQPSRDWKSVAVLVATETDPDKVFELASELIRALDENRSLALGRVARESKKSAA